MSAELRNGGNSCFSAIYTHRRDVQAGVINRRLAQSHVRRLTLNRCGCQNNDARSRVRETAYEGQSYYSGRVLVCARMSWAVPMASTALETI